MNIKEFREILTMHCEDQGIEVHRNYFKIISNYVFINDLITLNNISKIKLVGDEHTDNPKDITVWFNRNHIQLSDIERLSIGRVRSYLK